MTTDMAISEDYLLNGRVLVRQPVDGYRIAIDPIILAASINAQPGETIIDLGAGVGAASLCLAARIPECRIVALEIQRTSVRLAAENIALNNMRDKIEILHGDLLQPPPRLAAGTYAHVMTNPPYLEAIKGRPSPNDHKALSNVESTVTLEQWARFALLMVRPKGTVTFIHRADRLDEILSYFQGKLGDITIFPLWPGNNKPAKRIIIRGRKNSNAPLKILPGLVLHLEDGRYTPEAENILRNAYPINID